MEFYKSLGINTGITCVIGSGGKTSLLRTLAQELPGTVILTTTTHFYPFEGIPTWDPKESELPEILEMTPVICCGSAGKEGKLKAPMLSPETLAKYAAYVLVEADGSKGLPIKAHRNYEPVVPSSTEKTLLVVGASGFGKAAEAVCHCPELYAALAGCSVHDPVTSDNLAAVLEKENLADLILINQADECENAVFFAEALHKRLKIPVYYGSVKERWIKCLF